MNLNKVRPGNYTLFDGRAVDDYGKDITFNDNSTHFGGMSVYFRELEYELIDYIKNAEAVLVAAAWLTNFNILDALSDVNNSIVVQKEDFLRPDNSSFNISDWKRKLKEKYAKLEKNSLDRYDLKLHHLNSNSDPFIGNRCVGNYNRDKKPASPRMHNKFFVFCNMSEIKTDDGEFVGFYDLIPYGVWTGSFNPTHNASNSLENAIYTTNERICNAYFKEFLQIMSISESLDWKTDWCTPEWFVGT